MFNLLHSFLPSPILFDLGSVKVYWYGLIMAGAFLACFLVLAKLSRLKKDQLVDLSFWLVIFGLLGARLWHVLFYNWTYFLANPWEIVKVWHGGLAIHGALTAGLLVLYFYSRRHKLAFSKLADLLAVVLPLGQAIGRWGNYFNQELYGRACDYAWCLPISGQPRHFHPVFLYESLLSLILFVLLLVSFRAARLPAGAVALGYLAGYSVIRFFMEFLRLDINSALMGLNWLQWLCLSVILVSAGFFFALVKRRNMDYNGSS